MEKNGVLSLDCSRQKTSMYKYRKSLAFWKSRPFEKDKMVLLCSTIFSNQHKNPHYESFRRYISINRRLLYASRICNQAFPSKKINHLYGYRTRTSMQHQEAWDFAQKYSANEMMKLGTIMLVLAGAIWLADIQFKGDIVVAIALTVVFPLFMFFHVEQELKKRFPKT